MRKVSIIFLVILGLFQACDKGETALLDANCVQVSYVIGICGEAVLKIENPTQFHMGENWNGHENVFFTILPCGTDEQALSNGTFYVEIVPSIQDDSCVRCAATIGYSGSKRYHIVLRNQCTIITD